MDGVSSAPRGEVHPVVLVVDDEPLVRMHVADELVERGFGVIQAGCAEMALLLIAGRRVDVVVTDRRMPGPIDGDGLARAIAGRYPDVPVIMMSGDWPAAGETAHIVESFPKPVDATAIARLISRLLGERLRVQRRG